jgi:hypothetical protein
VVPLYCTKRTRLSQEELEVKIPEGVERYQENPSRIFYIYIYLQHEA